MLTRCTSVSIMLLISLVVASACCADISLSLLPPLQSTEAEIEAVTKKMMDETFDFNDYLKQSQMVKKMGSMAGVARMLPGMAGVYK
jgi:signal recognition particle GTPase